MIKKILAIPNISTTTDSWCEGDFVTFFQLAKVWWDVDVYIPLYKKANIPTEYRLPNLHLVELDSWYPYVQSQCLISSELFELFNPVDGRYQVDVILTSKTQSATYLKRMFTIGDAVRIPVAVIEPWANHKVSDLDSKLKAVTYSECLTFYYLDRERDICLTHARRYLSPSESMNAKALAVVQTTGIGAKYVQSVARSVKKFDRFTFCYAARFNGQKNWQKALTSMQNACKLQNGRVIAITPNDSSELPSHLTNVELLKPLPYKEYIETLCKSHASVCCSSNEGYSFGWSEQVSTGNPILFPDKDWVHSLFPKYPFVYRNDEELATMLTTIQKYYDKCRVAASMYSDEFVEKNDYTTCGAKILSNLDSYITGSWMDYGEWDAKWVANLERMPEEFSFELFVRTAAKEYKASFGSFIMLISSYRNIYKWLCKNVDVIRSKEMAFRKKRV